jgi:ABC-type transport system involved in multi-copper enzyme maturation permease subunit
MNHAKEWWQYNISQNPMLAEIERFRRKFFSFRGPNVQANGGLGLIVVLFLFYSIICIYNRGDMEPISQLMIYLGFALFVIPFMLHATIAGERERRSWDMLLVAPIAPSQIVMGKFVAAFLGLLLTFALFMVPIFILSVYYQNMNWGLLLLGIGVVVTQLLALTALTILISARVRRPLMALAVTIGVVLVVFLFIPLFMSVLDSFMSKFVSNSIYPFAVLGELARGQQPPNAYGYPGGYGSTYEEVQTLQPVALAVTSMLVQFVLTVALLAWAIKTLHFADNEVRFMNNKKKKNA